MNPLTILVPLLSASIVHPVSFSLSLSFSLLKFFTRPLLLPLRQVYYVLVLLIRMLLRLEPVYNFFGTAFLFGAIAGYMLHRTLRSAYQMLNIAPSPPEQLLKQKEPAHISVTGSLKEHETDDFEMATLGNEGQRRRWSGGIRPRTRYIYPRWLRRSNDPMGSSILEEDEE
ncbi:uncharacterized protein CIMG_09693 [Coccidioides immitis RS]|uniref:Uncharacterized protein n=1 Tax=Coccidioides immitis (strain RS) TaxID=246410 RepID=J3K2X9_COCIM|nr:uncharacterized protein CIMG_09693 [Coccidioides immitis RS]EAS28489.3 hypothetical protein CIMG_09693 [Coccidioides immitis RS]